MPRMTVEQRVFVVKTYAQTQNYHETKRLLLQLFGVNFDVKSVYKCVSKFNIHGTVQNRHKGFSGRLRTARTEVSFL